MAGSWFDICLNADVCKTLNLFKIDTVVLHQNRIRKCAHTLKHRNIHLKAALAFQKYKDEKKW